MNKKDGIDENSLRAVPTDLLVHQSSVSGQILRAQFGCLLLQPPAPNRHTFSVFVKEPPPPYQGEN